MRLILLIGVGALLTSCASSPPPNNRRVVSIGEAVERDSENEPRSGVYAKKSTGENLYVDVTNLRQKLQELERAQYEKKRELDFYRRKNESTEAKNDKLRTDLAHGQVYGAAPVTVHEDAPPPPQQAAVPKKTWDTSEYDSYNEGKNAVTPPAQREPASQLPKSVINSGEEQ